MFHSCVWCQDGIIGSATAFAALHAKMIEKKKVAIVRIIVRAGTAPRIAALLARVSLLASTHCERWQPCTPLCTHRVRSAPALHLLSSPLLAKCLPSQEPGVRNGVVYTPAGMYVIYLPYADDIRHLHLGEIGARSDLTTGAVHPQPLQLFLSLPCVVIVCVRAQLVCPCR